MERAGELCVAPPAAGSGGVLLQLYYCTGWRPAVLHYQQQLRGAEGEQHLQQQPWEEKCMEWCGGKELQQPDWHACELLLPEMIRRLEFVCCSADHTQWDNAPAAAQDGQKRNYVICFSESSSSNGSGRVLQQQTPPDMMPLAARVADQELAACCSSDGSSSSSAGLRGSSRSSCCANGEPASLQKKNTAAADSSRSAGLPSHGSGEGGGSSNSSSKSSSGNSSNRAASKPWRQCLRRIVCALVDGHIAAVEGPRCLLITDLDGTLIGNAAYVSQFLLHWKLRHLWRGSKLVYNTGRNLKDFLFAAGGNALLRPDYAILGVGTEVYEFSTEDKQNSSNSRPLEEWLLDDQERQQFKDDIAFCSPQWPTWCPTRRHAHLSSRWLERLRCSTFDRRDLARAAAENLPGCFVNGNIFYDPFRISLSVPASLMAAAQQQQHMEEQQHEEKQQEEDNSSACDGRSDAEERQRAVKYLLRLLKSPHMKTCVSGQGDWRFLDLLPLDGGKRSGSQFVMEALGFAEDETVVAGDSGNDAEMFLWRGVCGICVHNAQPDFIAFLQQQQKSCKRFNVSSSAAATGQGAAAAPTKGAAGIVKEAPGALRDVQAAAAGTLVEQELQPKQQRKQKQQQPAQREETGEICQVYFAEHDCAGGVMEGLVHFGFDIGISFQL